MQNSDMAANFQYKPISCDAINSGSTLVSDYTHLIFRW